MAQYIKQGNIFGRLGEGFGRGLADQIPKEIERNRLSSGLKELGDQKDLSPFQQFAALSAVPGITPQMIQSGSDLLRQQSIINSLQQQQQPKNAYVPSQNTSGLPASAKPSTALTKGESVQAQLSPYIPPTPEQRDSLALDLHKRAPGAYPSYQEARQKIDSDILANMQVSQSRLSAADSQSKVQKNLENEIATQNENLHTKLPNTIVNDIQQQAIKDIENGKSVEEAGQSARDKLYQWDRNYTQLKRLGGINILLPPDKDFLRSTRTLADTFAKAGRAREYADALEANADVTPMLSHAIAMPVNKQPELNKILKDLPDQKSLHEKVTGAKVNKITDFNKMIGIPDLQDRNFTNDTVPKLAKALGKDGSPLSVAHELEEKHYDPRIFLDYLSDHQDELGLTPAQIEEVGTKLPGYFGWLYNWWYKSFTGNK